LTVTLRPMSTAAAEDILGGRAPGGVVVADGYPTEFSEGVAQSAGKGSPLGPFFIHRADDDVVVGEIGGAIIEPGVAEIGYAIVEHSWGQGHASAAVKELIGLARAAPEVERLRGHTPLDRPASGRVLEKAGFARGEQMDDEHEGAVMRVQRWELPVEALRA
jgi:RimJ/RimL family protein N-acetyltransferase